MTTTLTGLEPSCRIEVTCMAGQSQRIPGLYGSRNGDINLSEVDRIRI